MSIQKPGAAASSRWPEGSGSITPTWPASSSHSMARPGSGTSSSAIGPVRTGSFVDPFPIALVEIPVLGPSDRLDARPLPQRSQPQDRLQAVRFADLNHRAGNRRQARFGPDRADRVRDRGVDEDLEIGRARPLQRLREVVDRAEFGIRLEHEQTQLQQSDQRLGRFGSQHPQRVGQARDRHRGPLGHGEEAQREPRADRHPRGQRLHGGGLVQVLSDLLGAGGRSNPIAVRQQTLGQPDRRQPRPL